MVCEQSHCQSLFDTYILRLLFATRTKTAIRAITYGHLADYCAQLAQSPNPIPVHSLASMDILQSRMLFTHFAPFFLKRNLQPYFPNAADSRMPAYAVLPPQCFNEVLNDIFVHGREQPNDVQCQSQVAHRASQTAVACTFAVYTRPLP